MMLIPDYQDTRSSKPWAVGTGAIFTERQKANITINLDDVDDIVIIKNGVRYKLKEYIRQEISDTLEDAYAHGYTDAEADFHKRKTGEWVPKVDQRYYCSRCDEVAPKGIRWNYCPNCGAQMEVEE